MTIFLAHIYSPVKYEVGQGRKNVAVVGSLYCPYHRGVSTCRRVSVFGADMIVIIMCSGIGRP
jgi:hypothetical protein